MKAFLHVLQDVALLVARVGLGALMILHGWRRWQSEGIAAQIEFLNQTSTPRPEVFAWGSVILEMLGGLFLVFGLLTPLVALAFLVEQILIIVYSKASKGAWVADGGWEYNVVIAFLCLLLAAFGAGRAGLDSLFKRVRDGSDGTDADEVGAGGYRAYDSTV